MTRLLRAGAVAIPFLLAFLAIRSCAQDEAARWRERVAEVEAEVLVAVDAPDLIVLAPGGERGRAAGRAFVRFRNALIEQHGDLLGRGRDQRTVVVQFSTLDRLQAFARSWRRPDPFAPDRELDTHGFTDPSRGAVFLPPEADERTLRHEAVHLLMAQSHETARYSPWISEGLAQLFEAFDPDATPPHPPGLDAPARALLARRLPSAGIDIERLVAMADYDRFAGADAARNYAEALALTAFLYEERGRDALRRYLEAERKDAQNRLRSFRAVYRHDEEPFRQDLQAWLRAVGAGGGR